MEEVDGRLYRDYESKLAEALKQMREDYEYQIRLTREETETVWLNKVNLLFNFTSTRLCGCFLASLCQRRVCGLHTFHFPLN